MKEITVLSGKGGTGKTSITAALASVAKNALICDNDVDASDLHLLFQPQIREENIYSGGWNVQIDTTKCSICETCREICKFGSIHYTKSGQLQIDPFQCEGCKLCERVCPNNAIISYRNKNNYWYVSDTRFGILVHAKLYPGEENSGKLISKIRIRAREIAEENKLHYIINDGPPGIGCTAISSLTGTQAVLLVTEPSKAALHDAKRLVELIARFSISVYAVINKFDIDKQQSLAIESYLKSNAIPVIARIAFTEDIIRAMIEGRTITEYKPESKVSESINKIWNILKQ